MGQAIIKNACFQDRNNFDIIQGRKFDSIVKFNHDVLSQYSNFTFLFADCFFFSTRTWLTLKLKYTQLQSLESNSYLSFNEDRRFSCWEKRNKLDSKTFYHAHFSHIKWYVRRLRCWNLSWKLKKIFRWNVLIKGSSVYKLLVRTSNRESGFHSLRSR